MYDTSLCPWQIHGLFSPSSIVPSQLQHAPPVPETVGECVASLLRYNLPLLETVHRQFLPSLVAPSQLQHARPLLETISRCAPSLLPHALPVLETIR